MAIDPEDLARLKSDLLGSMGGMSMMRQVGIGKATEHKLLSSKDCYFQVIELFPFGVGELKSDTIELHDSGVDAKGEAYVVTVPFGKSVKATWLPTGGNRATAPDIRRGERAEIFRLADSDKYYWRPMEMDQDVRRLETAMFLYSNTQDEATKELTPENSWMVEISTHQKTMSIKTPKSDGEEFAYDIQLNTKESTFVLKDDSGQEFELESKERRWRVANKDGSEILMDKKNITRTAPETIKDICKDYICEASNSITTKTKTHQANATDYSIKTTTYNNTSNSYKVSTSSLVVNYSTGSYSGGTNFAGTLTSNGVNVSSTHRHNGVTSGPSSTATPF